MLSRNSPEQKVVILQPSAAIAVRVYKVRVLAIKDNAIESAIAGGQRHSRVRLAVYVSLVGYR